MGFAVMTIRKPKGNDARTSAHIERRVHPANADRELTYLNQRLVEYPAGVENRTQAIQHRIDTAGIKRKISHNQVRALQVILTGTPADMRRIRAEGRLDEWCADNVRWLRDTFGKDNLVSADLHMDENTPHIHATVVPIVSGERRKVKEQKKRENEPDSGGDGASVKSGKRTYRKKPTNTVRLCADDVMTRDNLERFQDTYAEAMAKYGLQRGIRGSDARNISNQQHYRDLYLKKEDLKLDVTDLEEQKQEVYDKVRDLYDRKDEARDKFLDMHEYNKLKENEIAETEARLQQLKEEYEPYRAQGDLNLLSAVFPKLGEHLQTVQLCNGVGLTVEAIKTLFSGKPVSFTGKLHSPEHDRDFDVQDAKLELLKDRSEPNAPNKYCLSLNGQNILDWFREQFEKLRQVVRPYVRQTVVQPRQGKGRGV